MAVRVTQLVIEVLIKETPNVSVGDDLNNWRDVLHKEKTASDSLSNWLDAIQVDFLINVSNIPIIVSDNFITTTGPPPRYSWKDGIAFQSDPVGPLYFSLEDLGLFSGDEPGLGYGLVFSDDVNNLNDAVIHALGLPAEAFDTFFYTFSDSLAWALSDNRTVSDTLNNWLDTVTNHIAASNIIADSFSLGDAVALQFKHILQPNETLSLSDSITAGLSVLGASATDNLNNWLDAVLTELKANLTVTVADTLNNWSDAVSTLSATSTISYIRRYLDDVLH